MGKQGEEEGMGGKEVVRRSKGWERSGKKKGLVGK